MKSDRDLDNPFLNSVASNESSAEKYRSVDSSQEIARTSVVRFDKDIKREYHPTPIMTPRDKPISTPSKLNNNLVDIFSKENTSSILDNSLIKRALSR